MLIQDDGRIVAAGYQTDDVTNYTDFALARYGEATTTLTVRAPKKVPKGAKAKITGNLSSADLACSMLQQVELRKGVRVLATRTTSDEGAYRFALKITRKTSVQVAFIGTASCKPNLSRTKTIKPS